MVRGLSDSSVTSPCFRSLVSLKTLPELVAFDFFGGVHLLKLHDKTNNKSAHSNRKHSNNKQQQQGTAQDSLCFSVVASASATSKSTCEEGKDTTTTSSSSSNNNKRRLVWWSGLEVGERGFGFALTIHQQQRDEDEDRDEERDEDGHEEGCTTNKNHDLVLSCYEVRGGIGRRGGGG